MAQSAQKVANHYKRRALDDVILAALKAAGKDIEHVTPDDLAPVDEFHSGGRNATMRLAQLAGINGSERVLDVGCGIGGASPHPPSKIWCRRARPHLTPKIFPAPWELRPRPPAAAQGAHRPS